MIVRHIINFFGFYENKNLRIPDQTEKSEPLLKFQQKTTQLIVNISAESFKGFKFVFN
jgi:hypothetical protein